MLIEDLYKSVDRMQKHLDDMANNKVNIEFLKEQMEKAQNSIEKPPSAELRPDQLDTDSLPEYDILDPIIEAYVEEDLSLEAIVSRGFDEKIVRNVIDMINRNEYKRRQSPPGVKITPRAFGRDRRLPLATRYAGY